MLKEVMPQFGSAIDQKFQLYEQRHATKVNELSAQNTLMREDVAQVKLESKKVLRANLNLRSMKSQIDRSIQEI